MSRKRALVVGILLVLSTDYALASPTSEGLDTYSRCTELATGNQPIPAEAEELCLRAAQEGLPGAQYALGGVLASWNRYSDAIPWLRRAAEAKHPPASHLLGQLLLQSRDPAAQTEARALLTYALCSGYPPAINSATQAGLGETDCAAFVAPDLQGSWTAELKWMQIHPGVDNAEAIRIVFSGSGPRVFQRGGGEWTEIKPGKFKVSQFEGTLLMNVIDSGWDLDGKWIESLSLQLQRLANNEADLYVVRTVQNAHLPASTGLRDFATIAHGRASRDAQ